ncbi:hypothetical protein D3C80_1302820 [compost metagenome]
MLKLLPAIDYGTGKLRAELGNNNQAIALAFLASEKILLDCLAEVISNSLNLRKLNHTLGRDGFDGPLHVVVTLAGHVGDLLRRHSARHVFVARNSWRGIFEGLYINVMGVHN